MKALLDFLPAIAFFIGFKLGDIYLATKIGIGVTVALVVFMKFTKQTITPLLWMSLIVIVVFGGLTIALHDENFIKWKPTVLYWLIATVLLFSNLIFRKNLIQAMLEKQIVLPLFIWDRLNLSWFGFFLTMGCINLYVAFSFSVDTWVTFKLFGATGLMLVFIIVQMMMIGKYLKDMPPVLAENVTSNEQGNLEKNRK